MAALDEHRRGAEAELACARAQVTAAQARAYAEQGALAAQARAPAPQLPAPCRPAAPAGALPAALRRGSLPASQAARSSEGCSAGARLQRGGGPDSHPLVGAGDSEQSDFEYAT